MLFRTNQISGRGIQNVRMEKTERIGALRILITVRYRKYSMRTAKPERVIQWNRWSYSRMRWPCICVSHLSSLSAVRRWEAMRVLWMEKLCNWLEKVLLRSGFYICVTKELRGSHRLKLCLYFSLQIVSIGMVQNEIVLVEYWLEDELVSSPNYKSTKEWGCCPVQRNTSKYKMGTWFNM